MLVRRSYCWFRVRIIHIMAFLFGAAILVSITAESWSSLKTKPPHCVFSELGSAVWFNFSSSENANLHKLTSDCMLSEEVPLISNGDCRDDMDCSHSFNNAYNIPLFNITPVDAGTYIFKGDNGFSTSDNSSTELIPYEYVTTCHDGLDGEITLEVRYWGRLHNVTMHCPGDNRRTAIPPKNTFNETEVRVFGLRGGLINCTVQASSWCQSNSFICNTSLTFDISKISDGDCLSLPTSLPSTPYATSATEAIAIPSEDASTATTAPAESFDKRFLSLLIISVALICVVVVVVVVVVLKRNAICQCVQNAPPSGNQGSANTNELRPLPVGVPLLVKPPPGTEASAASTTVQDDDSTKPSLHTKCRKHFDSL